MQRWKVLSLLLQKEGYEELAEKCIFVAGHKAPFVRQMV